MFLATIYGINLCAVEPCRGVIADARCRAFRARQGLAKHYLSLRDPKMLSHFARKNAQFVARFYSFDYETSHCDVSAAQGDAGIWALILNPPPNQNLKPIPFIGSVPLRRSFVNIPTLPRVGLCKMRYFKKTLYKKYLFCYNIYKYRARTCV